MARVEGCLPHLHAVPDCGSAAACLWSPAGLNKQEMGQNCLCSAILFYLCGAFCPCLMGGPTRRCLRERYGLPEEPCADCCVACWCQACARECAEECAGKGAVSWVQALLLAGAGPPRAAQAILMGEHLAKHPCPRLVLKDAHTASAACPCSVPGGARAECAARPGQPLPGPHPVRHHRPAHGAAHGLSGQWQRAAAAAQDVPNTLGVAAPTQRTQIALD